MLVAFIGGVVVAAGAPGAASAGEGRLKAVVIVGPTGSMTDEYLRWGETIARTAERNGMQVARIYHPRALWSRVKEETLGANLIVYLGHGFGWPSPYPKSLFESQMDGFGLNYPEANKRSAHQTHYYGAEKVRQALRFAPNSVVILNHLCYASGHGEMHHARPTRDVAVKRVDNFANGFLKVGAGVVFALAFQPGETIVGALFGRTGNTMEDLFRRRFNTGGWNGWSPSRHLSQRTPGARILIDPHPQQSYRRAITGDLEMTVGQWRSGAPREPDSAAPELTGLTASAGGETATPEQDPISFNPNADSGANQVAFDYQVSEPGRVDLTITPVTPDEVEPAAPVRNISKEVDAGAASTTWDGTDGDGNPVAEGRYRVTASATDSSGNTSPGREIAVRVLKLVRAPRWDTDAIHARDNDALAASASFTAVLERQATVQVSIKDAAGTVIRVLQPDTAMDPGDVTANWNGRDEQGKAVSDGRYHAVITATAGDGVQRYTNPIWVGPFRTSISDATPRRGQRIVYRLTSTERLGSRPTLTVKQPLRAPEVLRMRAVEGAPSSYRAVVFLKARGGTGKLTMTVNATDIEGGREVFVERYPLR